MRYKRIVLTLVLISILGALVAGYAYLHFPRGGPPRLSLTVEGCKKVKHAAEVALVTSPPYAPCPTVADLVSSHHLSAIQSNDPWDTPYIIRCDDGIVHVTSAGGDRLAGTDDDLRDDLSPAEFERIERLYARRAHD